VKLPQMEPLEEQQLPTKTAKRDVFKSKAEGTQPVIMGQRTQQRSRQSKRRHHRCRHMGRPPMRWVWWTWTVDERRNRPRNVPWKIISTPVIGCQTRRRKAKGMMLGAMPPMIMWGPPVGTTIAVILATPHRIWRCIQTIRIRMRRAGRRGHSRNLDMRDTRQDDSWGRPDHGRGEPGR
jgi:hypothetical protein